MENKYFLEGEKVAFRPYQAEDVHLVHQWFNDPCVTYYMFTGQKPVTLEQTKVLMENELASAQSVVFTVLEKTKGNPIGIVGLYEINTTARKAEMRIVIGNKDSWGKGYGTEATEMITFYGFDRLNLNRIRLGFTSENKGAQRTYEKAGYEYEGTFKQDIYRNSQFYDSAIMAFLRDDYYKKKYAEHKKLFSPKHCE